MPSTRWDLYDNLISGVPEDIEVIDCCLGMNWAYVQAECGTGISHLVRGGAHESQRNDPRASDLRSLCELSKSWDFSEATLGVAALNAWYSHAQRIEDLGGSIDTGTGDEKNPFDSLKVRYAGKNIVVVGHFPNVEGMFAKANVTVLERNCTSPLDTPDPACEYVVPDQDFVFMTGITFTNKTMPRLLELARKACVAVVGPSAIPAPAMADAGVAIVAGSCVVDEEAAAFAIRSNVKSIWHAGIRKFYLEFNEHASDARCYSGGGHAISA